MKSRALIVMLLLLFALSFSVVFATEIIVDPDSGVIGGASIGSDDGKMFRRKISGTPDGATGSSAIGVMGFYVPVQNAAGELLGEIEYLQEVDDTTTTVAYTREYALPLVSVYIDGIEVDEEEEGAFSLAPEAIQTGVTFGHRDTFVAMSLDDGATWKNYNLSRAAHLSSFTLADGHDYPGDTTNAFMTVNGNKVFVAWLSKYCDGGSPLYTTFETISDTLEVLAPDYFFATPEGDLVLTDTFAVAGSQKSVDYALQGWEDVGEIPYSCVWTARGSLELFDPDQVADSGDEYNELIWRQAERLTSGRRDANKIEVASATNAGFVLVWQEDPDGLRPGQGLGPGEGWSGAIVNAKTDIWYSYVDWDNFDFVQDPVDPTVISMTLPPYLETYTTTPKVGVPMAMPLRLTDNDFCMTDSTGGNIDDPFCYFNFKLDNDIEEDFCAESLEWDHDDDASTPIKNVCVTYDGRVLWGRVGASRPRLGLMGYDSTDDGIDAVDSAWVVLAYEETKALGSGDPNLGGEQDKTDPVDIGKNLWYHSFDMFHPDILDRGHMLNQPAKDHTTATADNPSGDFFALVSTEDITNTASPSGILGDWDYEFYETEIARRFSLLVQPIANAQASEYGTTAILLYKQGIINQGGPADIFMRRLVMPEDYDPFTTNPYEYSNMECEEWAATDDNPVWYEGSSVYPYHPYYGEFGLCLSAPPNLSSPELISCDTTDVAADCIADFPWDTTLVTDTVTYPKVFEWRQVDLDDPLDATGSINDQSWENPYDVAKGHRGFIDGDFVMMMYAWSPNWKANSIGNDKYNLYVRRSFDGGLTWETTPPELGGTGTKHCENYLDTTLLDPDDAVEAGTICTEYAAGEFEQGRNVSQLTGTRITVLDPRYTPTRPDILTEGAYLYEVDDKRDPTRFFVVYETGDNTVQPEFAAVPLDLYYSRAAVYGDIYDVVEITEDGASGQFIGYRWDWLENQQLDLSGEASVASTASGSRLYAVWNQWQELEMDVITDSDDMFRRVMYLDDEETMDGMPTVSIAFYPWFASYDDGNITFGGFAEDNDHIGGDIVAYRWHSNRDGVFGTQQVVTMPATELSRGMHLICFTAQDAEGNWATDACVNVAIDEIPVYLPALWTP